VKNSKRKVRRIDTANQEAWSFEKFWAVFTEAIVNNEIVTYSAIQEGVVLLEQKERARQEYQEARLKEKEEREAEQKVEKERTEEYVKLKDELIQDETIRLLLNEGKILTGDDVRAGDPGFDLEVAPQGKHCFLIAKGLELAGFKGLEQYLAASEEDHWWTVDLANCWTILQELQKAEFADGVVESASLGEFLTEPDVFMRMRRRIEDEIERRETSGGAGFLDGPGLENMRRMSLTKQLDEGKPSMSELSDRLGLTVARLKWLHTLFEGFLVNEDDPEGPPPKCGYPDDPASLTKEQMKGLILELNPKTTDPEFESHYRRIDIDGGGAVEFDEFVVWLSENQINLTGQTSRKMTIAELAGFHDVTEDIVMFYYSSFANSLYEYDDSLVEGYPDEPAKMPKAEVQTLVSYLRPNMSDADFEAAWQIANTSDQDSLDFGEFLEMIDFDDLPEEAKKYKAPAEGETSAPGSPGSPKSPSSTKRNSK
jgi:Ca2+-binding EF-hand superfamily protein